MEQLEIELEDLGLCYIDITENVVVYPLDGHVFLITPNAVTAFYSDVVRNWRLTTVDHVLDSFS